MRRRLVLSSLAAAALVACGGTAAAPAEAPRDAPRVVLPRHDGKTFRLARGREVEFRLPGDRQWGEPKVRGRAVEVYRIDFFQDPGYSAWVVAARRAGRATVSVAAPGRRFAVTFVVPG